MATERFANTAQTTLSAAVTSGATTVTVDSASAFPNVAQFRVRVDSELMLVTALAGTTWTVTRGIEGTTAAAHPTGALVTQVLTASAMTALVGAVVPTGTVAPFVGLAVPAGWLECNGASVSRTTYADLFGTLAVVLTGTTTNGSPTVTGLTDTSLLFVGMLATAASGLPAGVTVAGITPTFTLGANATASGSRDITFSVYGASDTSSFNLPDFRGRALIGAGTGSGLTARVLGHTFGAETHQLTVAEMPSHTHAPISPYDGWWSWDSAGATTIQAGASYPAGASTPTTATGGDTPHNNMQPSAVIKWMIKT